MEGLHRLGIEGLSLHNILKLNIQPSETDYAVDIRSPAIAVSIYLNGPEASGQVPYHCLICALSKIYKCLYDRLCLSGIKSMCYYHIGYKIGFHML